MHKNRPIPADLVLHSLEQDLKTQLSCTNLPNHFFQPMDSIQAGEFARVVSHRVHMDENDDNGGGRGGGDGAVATAGTFQSHREEQMLSHTSSDVTGNTAREDSTMYNADVNRRTVNQSGNHMSGGAVHFNLNVITQESQYQMNRPSE